MYDVYLNNELVACPVDEAAMRRVVEKLKECPYPFVASGQHIRVDQNGETVFYKKVRAAAAPSSPAR